MNNKDNILTPEEMERSKTPKQKAEDVSYTFNHSLICTVTDFIDPYIGNAIQKHLGNKSQLPNAYAAEFIGDFGAVPVTIAAQRMFPSVMHWIKQASEPLFKGVFLSGAKREAKEWAKRHGHAVNSKEYEQKVWKIYNYEMDHLPQAFVWTVSAVGLNVAAQKALGNKAPVHHITAGKVGGSLLTAAITLGGRSLFPRHAEKFDKWTSEKILLPLEDKVYDTFGIKHNDDDYYLHKNKHKSDWSERVKADKDSKSSAVHI